MFEKGGDKIFLILQCAELLLESVNEENDKKYILIPMMYEDLDVFDYKSLRKSRLL